MLYIYMFIYKTEELKLNPEKIWQNMIIFNKMGKIEITLA